MNTTSAESGISASRYRLLLFIIGVLASALRFHGLGVRGLWIDEAYSWGITQLSTSEFLHGLTTRALDMAFYYILLRWWSALGDSEFLLRAFSATCSVLTVPVVAEVGRRLYSKRAGLLSATLFSLHVFSLHYAQEARSYALVVLLAALGWLQLVRIVDKPSNANWLWFAIISTLAFYSHFLAVLNVVAQLLTLLCVCPVRTQLRSTLRGIGMVALGILPASGYILHHAGDNSWIPPLSWVAIREFFDSVAGQVGSRIYLLFVAVLLLVLVYRSIATIKAKGVGRNAWAASVPVVGSTFPVVALLLISLHQPLFISRYLAATVLPFVWGIASLCCMPSRRHAANLIATILIFALSWPIPSHFRQFTLAPIRFQDLRGSADYIQRHQRPGDAIIIWEPLLRTGIEYYARRPANCPELLFPAGAHLRPEDIAALPDPKALGQSLQRHPRVWFVRLSSDTTGHPGWSAFLEHSVSNGRVLVSELKTTGVILEEYESVANQQ